MGLVFRKPVLFSRESGSTGARHSPSFFRRLSAPFCAYYHSGKAFSSFERREYGEAILHCDKMLLHNPENPLAYLIKGSCHYKQCEYSLAIPDLVNALLKNATNPHARLDEITVEANSLLAGIYMEERKYETAAGCLAACLPCIPLGKKGGRRTQASLNRIVDTLFRLGIVFGLEREYEKAAISLNVALLLCPGHKAARQLLGALLQKGTLCPK